jgi:tRNA wybutosine-synthesizing protein 2
MSKQHLPTENGSTHSPRALDEARVVVLVPRAHVKHVKIALEKHAIFDKRHGISPGENDISQRMRIVTTLPCLMMENGCRPSAEETRCLDDFNLHDICPDISYSSWIPPTANGDIDKSHSPLLRALREALQGLPKKTLNALDLSVDALVAGFPEAYSIYAPLLLLPSNTLSKDWISLIANHPHILELVWSHIASSMRCTHMALNSPIPASNSTSSVHALDTENVIRSPVNITPLYGCLGPAPTAQILRSPSTTDFAAALWVTTRQNGIVQSWAPLYTMFSRGNVKEKARMLHLPSVRLSIDTDSGAVAVDLYAGIGYFSFSYRRAGMKRVLCWELNPWSVEGLCRGAALNGWTARVFTPADVPLEDAANTEWAVWRDGVIGGCEDFWIFAMSNETADCILACLEESLPPIRHVNLGLLPVSRPSWPSAVRALNATLGGWVHAHENVGVDEMDERVAEVEEEFQRMSDKCAGEDKVGRQQAQEKRKVRVEHVERVKMYAPGVVHVVFDVHIPALRHTDGE